MESEETVTEKTITMEKESETNPPASKKRKIDDADNSDVGAGGLDWKNGPDNIAASNTTPLSSLDDGISSRRRRTRASMRFSNPAEDSPSNNEEDIDDPDYQQLSDSDDDPDFAPSSKKENTNEFSYRGRGRGRGSKRGRGRPAPQSLSSSRVSSSQVSSSSKSTLDSRKQDTRPSSDSTVSSSSTSKGASGVSPNSSQTSETNGCRSDSTASSSVGSTSSSTVAYPIFKRQSQAVRLPEGPQLTPEQLKEIEAQFKSGDFVMAKKDMELENPPIWRIDGKSLLQKFQAFDKDGKILYRNISTYSGWTSQSKTLYVSVKTNFIFQSRYDIVVELVDGNSASSAETGSATTATGAAGVTAAMPDKRDFKTGSGEETILIPEELNQHMATFEIFLQTLISQALDSNFLAEIYEENDDYFVERVKVIEDLTKSRKEKLLQMTKWSEDFQKSLSVWPCVNIMSSVSSDSCEACSEVDSAKLALFYGQPYDEITLKPRDDSEKQAPNKNYNVCERCARLCQTYNAITHRKYDYYSKCKTTVTNIRVSQPSKNTTTILRELLGNDTWITGLFRAMCTGFVRVDRMHEDFLKNKKSEEEESSSGSNEKST